jgi:hypothetical protein
VQRFGQGTTTLGGWSFSLSRSFNPTTKKALLQCYHGR